MLFKYALFLKNLCLWLSVKETFTKNPKKHFQKSTCLLFYNIWSSIWCLEDIGVPLVAPSVKNVPARQEMANNKGGQQ